MPHDPLILTAAFDPAASLGAQRLRDRHFPADRNIVPAHVTLFHHLPGSERAAIEAALAAACGAQGAMPFRSVGLRFLGRGVALEIEAARLPGLRRRLAEAWLDWLTAQDRQPFRPHLTVQNKAAPAAARALMAQLQAEGVSLAGTVVGLDLWHYRGGPWEPAGHFAFTAP